MKLGMRAKLLFGFLAVALFTGGLGAYTLRALDLLSAQLEAMYVDDLDGIYLLDQYSDVTWESRTSLANLLFSDDPIEQRVLRQEILASDAQLPLLFEQMIADDIDKEDTASLRRVTSAWIDHTTWRDQHVLTALDAGDHAAAVAAYRGEGTRLANAFAVESDVLLDEKHASATTLAAASQATYVMLRNTAIALSLGAITLGLLIGFLLSRSIAGAAGQLASAAKGLAQGNLDQRITFHSHDELGSVADAFREMVAFQQHMALAANAIAAGDLTNEVQPKADTDVLGVAFQRMTRGLRRLLSERAIADQAVIDADERRRLALEAVQDVIYDSDLRPAGTTVWSPSTREMFGYEPGEMGDTTEQWSDKIHPDDWPRLTQELTASMTHGGGFTSEYRHLRKNGSYADVLTRGKVLLDEHGRSVRLVGAMMDITERKLAEEALRASEERFRKRYKSFPLPTYSWVQVGDDFVLQDYNDAADAITGGVIRDALGKRASEWFADVPEILADLKESVADKRTLRRELRYRYRTTGLKRQLVFSLVFVPPQSVMIHTEDVTEARQAEQQHEALVQSEKLRALGQMATGIAHDLNQSLMLVASYSDLARQALVQEPPNLAEMENLLMTTTQAALDGGESVKRLLQFTRAAPEQDSQLVDLSNVMRDAAQLTAPRWRDAAQLAGRPISLHIETEGHPIIQGSASQLRDLATNVIFNAVDALPTGGTIRLRVLADGGYGILEITDSGVGMTAEVQERVFEPFYTTKGEGGTGLGLAMVFRIVEQHDGRIELRSAPGDGTTFRISFPLVDGPAEVELAPIPVTPLAPLLPLRVLAVDDEPMMTKAVMRMLKPAGHMVSMAASGEEALEQLAGQTFDVVVSDMGMGAGMNGWDLADAVKRRWPEVRFLLATGWGAAIDPVDAKARGVEAVLSKPYHPAELLRLLVQTGVTA
jgi:PAS domain S-box-containing protein